MFNKKIMPILILASSLLVLIFLERNFYLINILIHSLVDLFAGGRSLVKVELFFGYTLMLCGIVAIPQLKHRLGNMHFSPRWIISSVLIALGYNLSLLLIFLNKFNFDLRSHVVALNNQELSSTNLLHNHLMKGFNGLFLQLFDGARQENVDTGLAFVGLLPSALYIIGGLLVLSSAVLLVIKFASLYSAKQKWGTVFLIFYAIVSFSLLKNMLDGGPFNRETPIALGFLIALILYEQRHRLWYAWSALPLLIYSSVITLFWPFFFWEANYLIKTALPMVTLAGLLTAAMTWAYHSNKNFWPRAASTIIAIGLLVLPITKSVQTYLNSREEISQEGVLVGLYNDPSVSDGSQTWEIRERIGDLRIYHLSAKQPLQVKSILAQNNLLGNLQPITIPGTNCDPHGKAYRVSFDLHTYSPFELKGNNYRYVNIVSLQDSYQNRKSGLYNYRATMEFHNCAPRMLNLIQEVIKDHGHQTFFLSNLSGRYESIQ